MTEQAIDWEKTAQAVAHLISIIRHELGEDAEPTPEERENQYKRGLQTAIKTNTYYLPYFYRHQDELNRLTGGRSKKRKLHQCNF
jgi:hypothetical protein